MPKRTRHPKLRAQSWRTAGGEVRTAYYYDMRGTGERDVPLGTDYAQALRRWAEIHLDAPRKVGTLAEAFDRWTVEELPKYRPTTLRDYRLCLTQLRPVFDAGRWADITLPVLRAYLRKRTAKTRANRELSVLQVVWHWAPRLRREVLANVAGSLPHRFRDRFRVKAQPAPLGTP